MALPTLTEFTSSGNSITYALAGHTAAKPRLVLQKRKVPSNGSSAVAQTSYMVLNGTEDSDGAPQQSKISIEIVARFPIDHVSADMDAAIADFQAIVADTNFKARLLDQFPLA